MWFPASANQLAGSARSVRYLKIVARLREGVTTEQGREGARRLGVALSAQHPEFDRGFEWDARPLSEQVTGKIRVSMLLLLGTVGFVLLMTCANVANLLAPANRLHRLHRLGQIDLSGPGAVFCRYTFTVGAVAKW